MKTFGTLLEVKRFSIHDGAGVRTTLFLKGCPLHCCWCHNPESISPLPQLAYYGHKCINCEECITVCPAHAHSIEKGKHSFDRKKCLACGKCETVCLGNALRFYGKKVTVEEAVQLAIEDIDFYGNGGGVTISGGEPLMQPDFCASLFQKLKQQYAIHTAIETCGYVSWQAFEKVLPWTDFFLYDFKQDDPLRHKEQTGQDNILIKENLLKLSQTGKPIEIHMPLIPGCNTDKNAIDAAGLFLSRLNNLIAIRLLPYHSLAHAKYAAVGREDTLPDVPTPQTEFLASCAAILGNYNLKVIY